MAVGFPAGITQAYIVNNAQSRLAALLKALEACEDFYKWISAYSSADLQAAPVSLDAGSAQALLDAFADVHQEYEMHLGTTGFPTATLPYNFSASQRKIIGPLTG